jgi:hypothetical protein
LERDPKELYKNAFTFSKWGDASHQESFEDWWPMCLMHSKCSLKGQNHVWLKLRSFKLNTKGHLDPFVKHYNVENTQSSIVSIRKEMYQSTLSTIQWLMNHSYWSNPKHVCNNVNTSL